MQHSTKYDVGDMLYHRALERYVLITDIFISKWDKENRLYRFIYLNCDADYLDGIKLTEEIDKSNYWIKVS